MLLTLVLSICVVIVFVIRQTLWNKAKITTKNYLKKFNPITDLKMYEVSKPLFNFGEKKIKHAVLLIHGFSCSTDELVSLTQKLSNYNFTLYAPMLTGFGLSSLDKLYNITTDDWLRDSICAYDLLSSIAEEISIVGHSTGSVLATYVAQNRKVKHLILTGPNFFVSDSESKIKQYLTKKYIKKLTLWFLPAIVKPTRSGRITFTDTLEPLAAQNVFHHPSITLKSLMATWELQDKVDILKAKYETLTVMYGKQDLTVNVKKFIKLLDENNVNYKQYEFKNTAHNVLEDYDKDEAIKIILDLLMKG